MRYNQSSFEESMRIGVEKILFYLPGCASLKEKRSRIKPLIERLQRQFNVSVAETDHQDIHQSALIAIVLVNNDQAVIQAAFADLDRWIETHFPDLEIQNTDLEII